MPRFFALITLLLAVAAAPALAQSHRGHGGRRRRRAHAAATWPPSPTAASARRARRRAARSHGPLPRHRARRGGRPRADRRALRRQDRRPGCPRPTTVDARTARFLARWRTDHIGRFRLRARGVRRARSAAAASPELGLTVYKPGRATWYGPGFYGRTHRLRAEDVERAGRRRPPHAAVRHQRRRLLQGPHAHRPGRRPRAVRERRPLGPHRRHGAPRSASRHTDTLGAVRLPPAPTRSALSR